MEIVETTLTAVLGLEVPTTVKCLLSGYVVPCMNIINIICIFCVYVWHACMYINFDLFTVTTSVTHPYFFVGIHAFQWTSFANSF